MTWLTSSSAASGVLIARSRPAHLPHRRRTRLSLPRQRHSLWRLWGPRHSWLCGLHALPGNRQLPGRSCAVCGRTRFTHGRLCPRRRSLHHDRDGRCDLPGPSSPRLQPREQWYGVRSYAIPARPWPFPRRRGFLLSGWDSSACPPQTLGPRSVENRENLAARKTLQAWAPTLLPLAVPHSSDSCHIFPARPSLPFPQDLRRRLASLFILFSLICRLLDPFQQHRAPFCEAYFASARFT